MANEDMVFFRLKAGPPGPVRITTGQVTLGPYEPGGGPYEATRHDWNVYLAPSGLFELTDELAPAGERRAAREAAKKSASGGKE